MITDIRVQNFRSYKDESFEFIPGVNIIVGPNASGKTNLLEALLVLTTGKSYRAKDPELIRFKQTWARIDAHDKDSSLKTIKLQTQDDKINKTYEIDQKVYKKIHQSHKLPVVLFEPNHTSLTGGKPYGRREYLDKILEQTDSEFRLLKNHYLRTLTQRNALLKKHQTKDIFIWDVRLSELAGKIVTHRQELIETINKKIEKTYYKLSKKQAKIQVSYSSVCDTKQYGSSMLKILQKSVKEDSARGFTTIGPHRDDILITINGHLVKDSASRGESRTLTLALKIIEKNIVEELTKSKPILLMDDVFSELDGVRRQELTKQLKNYQTFITTTDADVVIKNFTSTCNVIPLG